MSSNTPIQSIFPISPIGSGANFLSGYAFKGQDFCNEGLPVIKIKNIQNRVVTTHNSQCVPSALISKKLNKFILSDGDILIAMTGQGSVGRVGKLKCDRRQRPAMNQRVGKFLANESSLHKDFLYYVISSEVFENHLFDLGSGSGQPNLSPDIILSVGIPFPSYLEQVAIADILNALDDRIDLLHETNATLESIAQAMFKSWFVDFGPVHVKQQGRTSEGMDEATASLFPNSFDESELGLVPSGWKISTLGDYTTYLNRGISPKYVENGGVLVINQKCIRDFIVDLSRSRRHDPVQRKIEGREIYFGDVLVNSTGVGTLGRVAQVLTLDEPSIVDSHITVVRASNDLGWNYLGLALMRKQPEIEDFGEGTTGQTELSRGKLASIRIVVPPKLVLNQFDQITVPLRKRFAANLQQAQTLATLRDTLIPRLISGQLRISEAEAMLKETTA